MASASVSVAVLLIRQDSALKHRIVVCARIGHLHHRIPVLDQFVVLDAIDINEPPFIFGHFIPGMENDGVAVRNHMFELDFLFPNPLRGKHFYELLYALGAIGNCRIVLNKILAHELVYSRYVQITENSLVGPGDGLLIARAHCETPWKTDRWQWQRTPSLHCPLMR